MYKKKKTFEATSLEITYTAHVPTRNVFDVKQIKNYLRDTHLQVLYEKKKILLVTGVPGHSGGENGCVGVVRGRLPRKKLIGKIGRI